MFLRYSRHFFVVRKVSVSDHALWNNPRHSEEELQLHLQSQYISKTIEIKQLTLFPQQERAQHTAKQSEEKGRIRNQYNQVLQLTQDAICKSDQNTS